MRSQLRGLPDRGAHRVLGVMLAALGALLAGPAAGQNQPNVTPSTQAQTPATKRSVAAPGTKAQTPGTSAPPKPSLLHRLFGGNKSAQPDNGSSRQDGSAARQQQPFWKKIPLLGGHSASSTEASHAASSTAGASRVAAKPQLGSPRAGAPGTPGPRDDRSGGQTPQRLAALGPSGPARRPALLSPPSGPRTFPARPGPSAAAETRMPNGNVVRTAADGSVTDMHIAQHNMSVHYGLSGSRQVRVDRPDGSRIVLASRGVPYIQKPWNFGARAFDHRTFFDNGRLYHQFYRPYSYGDATLDVYAPQRFYSQEFYQWVAKPQAWVPPAWTYNTKQDAWYAHYQRFFTPQPSYDSPLSWLTDFVLAMSLFEAYNAHPLPAQARPAPPPAVLPAPQLQAATAPAPIVPAPAAQTPTAAGATLPGAPVTLARTAYAPIVAPPVPAAPAAQAPIVAAPITAPIAPPSGPAIPTGTGGGGTSVTLWQRLVDFIRGLWGEAPSVQSVAAPTQAVAPVAAEPVAAESAAPITADVKSMVADEIERQIEQESHEARGNAQNQEPKPGAGSVIEELRRPTQHVFVVASDLDLVDDTGRRCMISEGDVVQIISAVNARNSTASAVVLSSKGGVECAHSATVDIGVSDLQEMQNHMRATIDQGLANTPRGASEATVTPAFAAAAPPPDTEARSAIEQQKAIAAAVDRG